MSEQGDWEKYVAPWKDSAQKPLWVTEVTMDKSNALTVKKMKKALEIMKAQADEEWQIMSNMKPTKIMGLLELSSIKPAKTTADNFWEKIG